MIGLTLFTTCKPFKDESETIQANALTSWSKLTPACDILVFGNEEGVAEHCKALGIRHIETVPRNEHGTPLLNGLFQAAERESSTKLLGFVNADIMLTSDLLAAVERVTSAFQRFLLISRRWNVDLNYPWDFGGPDWESQLRAYAQVEGRLEPVYGGMDLFVYTRGAWPDLPPFAIGRGRCDSALIYQAVKSHIPIIDATKVVTCVHQNHGYLYDPDATVCVFKGPEAAKNNELLGGDEHIFTALNATYVLGTSGIRRQLDLYPPHLLRRFATLPGQYAILKPLAPIVRSLAPFWRRRTQRLHQPTLEKVGTSMACPYPISISARSVPSPKPLPQGGGVETFDTPEARAINMARTEHLRSLELPLKNKTVLDAGCGVGHLAQFFVQEGCDVLCVDGRQQNIDRLKVLYPKVKARVFDLEREPLSSLGQFDVVFAYGLLYHLENPFKAIRDLASVCNELLLLETVVVDHSLPIVRMQEETSTYSQALWGVGSRPSPSYVALAFQAAGFEGVYAPSVAPNHHDFQFEWKNDLSDMRDGHLLRCIFVASRYALNHPSLVSLFQPSPC